MPEAAPGSTPWVTPREGLSLVSVAARPRLAPLLAAAIERLYRIALPDPGHWEQEEDLAFVWSAPGQWIALAGRRDLYDQLLHALAGVAGVIDLTDSAFVLRLSGSGAREVLQKGTPIDMHPRAMRPGTAASTVIAHIGVLIWQVDEAPTYDIACMGSYAASLRRWVAGAVQRQTLK